MTPPIDSTATQSISTIAFGIIAALIGFVAIWQGRKAWCAVYIQHSQGRAESDLESRDYAHLDWSPCMLTKIYARNIRGRRT